jgi:hypothetical protein
MEELAALDKRYNEIVNNRKLKNLKICYSNIEDINDLINKLNQLDEPIINSKKYDLIEIYKKEKKMNINYIINLSYLYFMNNIDSGNDYSSVLTDIQNSSFYSNYKNNLKIQTMEFYSIIKELEKTNDYSNILIKLNEFSKNVFDLELKNEIEELIKDCEIKKINNEKNELKKLLHLQEFGKVKIKYENLLKNYKKDYINKNIRFEYNCLLKNIKDYQIEI